LNILFVYPVNSAVLACHRKPLNTQENIHHGIAHISSFLREHGHQTRVVVLSRLGGGKNRRMLDEYIRNFSPRLIGFTAVSTEYPFIRQMAEYIKSRHPHIYQLIGGPHVSLNPEEISDGPFDALCIGEGEYPTLDLVSQMDKGISPGGIPNLWIKRGREIEKNLPRPFLQDLDCLPLPDREMWQEWVEEIGSRYSVLLGRGCPYECTYCCNHAFRRLAPEKYVRLRSPEKIVEEIRGIVGRSPKEREIYLEVETFGLDREWALDLCSRLEDLNKTLSRPLTFGTNLRVTPRADLEWLFAAFRRSNFRFVGIGLESGSERIRREVLRRNYSNEDILRAVSQARKYGLKINLYNLIGIPGETPADFQETVRMNRTLLPDWHNTSIFYPYPGTDLYALCQKEGLLQNPLRTERERREAVLDLPGFSRGQIEKSLRWFDYFVYRGRRKKHRMLGRILLSRLRLDGFFDRHLRTALPTWL
jgi:anaerobic magnesium-protoporphyrin IX monomethyl ester cyclase